MSPKDWMAALRVAGRELRAGIRGFGVFLGCLFLGVLAISAVGSVGRALEEGLSRDARAILGGDVSVALTSREASGEELTYLESLGRVARTYSSRAMARTGNASILADVKGVDGSYPLYGESVVEGSGLHEAFASGKDLPGAVADRALFTRLGLSVGDTIQVGGARFRLTGVLLREPDRVAGVLSLGPRVMTSAEAFRLTGLISPGSLFQSEYLLRLSSGVAAEAVEAIRARFPDAGWRVRDFSNAAAGVRTTLERLRVQLTLVGLTALLVGGLGIAGGVRGYLEGRLVHMAAMKCMGGSTRTLFASYLLQILVLGALGAGAGMIAGGMTPAWAGTRCPSPSNPACTRRLWSRPPCSVCSRLSLLPCRLSFGRYWSGLRAYSEDMCPPARNPCRLSLWFFQVCFFCCSLVLYSFFRTIPGCRAGLWAESPQPGCFSEAWPP